MRLARHSNKGVLTHVISRFVDKRWMLSDDTERKVYLDLLGRALAKSDWRCVCFALMSSHLHFGMIPGDDDLQSWAKSVNSPFAQWLNKRHARLGPVFADRPAEWAVQAHPADLIAYIHNNPVRAKVVARADLSTWTSHRAYLGALPAPPWLQIDEGLALCGFAGERDAFNAFVDRSVDGTQSYPDLAALRAAVRGREPLEIGTPVIEADGICVPLLRARDSVRHVAPALVLERTLAAANISAGELCSRSQRPASVTSRRVFIHAAVRLGSTVSECGRIVGISPQAASKHLSAQVTGRERALIEKLVVELRTLAS